MVLRTGARSARFPLKKSKLVRQTDQNKLAAAVKRASFEATKPLDGKPLCLKAQLEKHTQKSRPKSKPTATVTSGAYETEIITPFKPAILSEPSDADEIELSILDKDLLVSESDNETDIQPKSIVGPKKVIEHTPTLPEVVGLSNSDIDQQISAALDLRTQKRKRSVSNSSDSSDSSSASGSSSDSSTSSNSSSSGNSHKSKKSKQVEPDSSSSSVASSPKILRENGNQNSSGSDSDDFGLNLANKLDALADSIISSTTHEPLLISDQNIINSVYHEPLSVDQPTSQTGVQKSVKVIDRVTSESITQLSIEDLPKSAGEAKAKPLTPSPVELTATTSELAPTADPSTGAKLSRSQTSERHPTDSPDKGEATQSVPPPKQSTGKPSSTQSRPNLGPLGRVTSQSRLPKELVESITPIIPN